MEDTCIYVVDHTTESQINEHPYRLLRVGSHGEATSDENADADATGDSISYKNFAYCELTGLYWIWKNTSHEITGIAHYRRYLASPETGKRLTEGEMHQALKEHEILVPKPLHLACSVAEDYCYCHIAHDLVALRKVMDGQPEKYRTAFAEVMDDNVLIPCNIMIARKELFDEYCSWLFPVLDECERYIDLYAGRTVQQQRVFGYLAERLLNVWIKANDIDCGYFDIMTIGSVPDIYELQGGAYDLKLSSALDGLKKDQLFDEEFYYSTNPDIGKVYPKGEGLAHYLRHGIGEHRLASPAYSMDEYIDMRPELRVKFGESYPAYFESLSREIEKRETVLSRNIVLGLTKDGIIDYAPVYDWSFYTTKYDDVPSDYHRSDEALKHFIEVGMPEGRQGSKGFSLTTFKQQNPHLVEIIGDRNRLYYLLYLLGIGRSRHSITWRYAE